MENVTNNNQIDFVNILKKYVVLLNKSQLPSIKSEKVESIKKFRSEYELLTGIKISEDQIKKKINNMKTEVKKKADVNRTGNKPIKLKEWEKVFLDLLEADKNPSISCIPGGLSVGASNTSQGQEENNVVSVTEESLPGSLNASRDSPVAKKKKKFQETEETKNLTNGELQRLVLLEQLKLIRMQQEEIGRRLGNENSNPSTGSSSANIIIDGENTLFQL